MSDDRLNRLEDRLDQARQEYRQEYEPQTTAGDGKTMGDGARAGVELVGGLIGGGLIGYGLDRVFGTSPILFILFLLLGVLTGFYNIYKITKNMGTSVGFKPLPNPPKDAKQGANFDDEDD